MQQFWRFLSFLIVLLPLEVDARTECFHVVGKLRCPTNSSNVAGVQIDLMDEDPLPFEIDDTIGRTWSKRDGSFTVSGCGHDVGPFNTPDGYLRILHQCKNADGNLESPLLVDVIPLFMPHIVDLGSIYLDRNFVFEASEDED